jgi:hypothetical protein
VSLETFTESAKGVHAEVIAVADNEFFHPCDSVQILSKWNAEVWHVHDRGHTFFILIDSPLSSPPSPKIMRRDCKAWQL